MKEPEDVPAEILFAASANVILPLQLIIATKTRYQEGIMGELAVRWLAMHMTFLHNTAPRERDKMHQHLKDLIDGGFEAFEKVEKQQCPD